MKQTRFLAVSMTALLAASSVPFPANAAETALPETAGLCDVLSVSSFLLDDGAAGSIPDFDGNGVINAVDLTLAKSAYLNGRGLENFRADKGDILLGTEETVTFTVKALNCDAAPVLYDGSGKAVSEMYDDGTNGDAAAGDGIFTAQLTLQSDDFKNTDYYAGTDKQKSSPYRICFYRDLTEEELSGYADVLAEINEITEYAAAVEYLENSDSIANYTVDETAQSIFYETVWHVYGYWEPLSEEADIEGRGPYAMNDLFDPREYDKAEYVLETLELEPAHPDNPDVLVLCPYQNDPTHPMTASDFEDAGKLTAKMTGGSLTILKDEAVTIEQMKHFGDYGVILINSHGGHGVFPYFPETSESGMTEESVVLAIGQYISASNYTDWIRYSADLTSGRIVGCHDGHAAVTANFFAHYYEDYEMNRPFIYLGSCSGLYGWKFGTVLRDKGAGAVVGFSDTVHMLYDYWTLFEVVINSMLFSGDTVLNGIHELKRIHGNHDYFDKEDGFRNTRVDYVGDPDYRLVNAVSRPRYHRFELGFEWDNAEKFCKKIGGHLATVTSAEEEALIDALVRDGEKNSYWLGAEYKGLLQKSWKWVTGEDFEYTHWAKGQPDYDFETCLMIYRIDNPVITISTRLEWNNLANDGTFGGEEFFGLDNFGLICEFEN